MKINSTKIIIATTLISLSLSSLNAQTSTNEKIIIIEVPAVNAVVPSVIVKTVSSSKYDDKKNTKLLEELNATGPVGMSKRVPPNYNKKEVPVIVKDAKAGEVNNKRISAYLQTTMIDKKELISKLEGAGFKVISEFKVDKKVN